MHKDLAGKWIEFYSIIRMSLKESDMTLFVSQLVLCTASLLPEFQPAPSFLSAIIGHID